MKNVECAKFCCTVMCRGSRLFIIKKHTHEFIGIRTEGSTPIPTDQTNQSKPVNEKKKKSRQNGEGREKKRMEGKKGRGDTPS